MTTCGAYAIGRRRDDAHIPKDLLIERSSNHFCGEGQRRINGAIGDPVPLMPQAFDCEFCHSAGNNAKQGRLE